METLQINTAGKIQIKTLNGQRHAVVPMVMIVPGVLNGSKGSILYTEEENRRSVKAWNGMPITVNHPTSDGISVSARNPAIIEKVGIGTVFNAVVDDEGKLKAEAWINIVKTQKVDNRIFKKIKDKQPVELSTGLFMEAEPAPEGSVFNNKEYGLIAKNYAPDHLAILPDQKGACSLEDGCGLLINELNHSELYDRLDAALTGRFTQDEPRAWVREVYDDYIIYTQGDSLYKLSYSKTSDGNGVVLGESPQRVMQETNFVPVSNEETSMEKSVLIDKIVANCSCWSEEDKEVLNGLSDDKLKAFLDQQTFIENQSKVAKAASDALKQGIEVNGQKYKFVDNQWVPEKKEDQKSEPVSNKEMTADEWLNSQPPAIAATFRNALRIENEQKESIIDKLVANAADDKKDSMIGKLRAKSLEELQDMEELLPKAPVANKDQETGSVGSFIGAFSGGRQVSIENKMSDADVIAAMTPPSILEDQKS